MVGQLGVVLDALADLGIGEDVHGLERYALALQHLDDGVREAALRE